MSRGSRVCHGVPGCVTGDPGCVTWDPGCVTWVPGVSRGIHGVSRGIIVLCRRGAVVKGVEHLSGAGSSPAGSVGRDLYL